MNLPVNDGISAYPKWVNVVLSVVLPGSGHFLSGKKIWGIFWFFVSQAVYLGALSIVVSALVSGMGIAVVCLAVLAIRVLIIVDSCRKPIPRINSGTWAGFCVLVIIIPMLRVSAVRSWFYRPFQIPTASMQPTLMGKRKLPGGGILRGDHIIVDECTYHFFRRPVRGDVAVFKTAGIQETERLRFGIPTSEYYVKRVVGMPGEKVSVRSSDIFINGEKLSDPKIMGHISVDTNAAPGLVDRALPDKEVELGPDEYFVIGDNMLNSLDSRYFGAINREFFLGRVSWIFWPLARRGVVQ